MIYGKLWCVVRPSVGIPIIIGAVAVASFSVHLALTINTTWVKGFLNGGAGKVAAISTEITPQVAALTIQDVRK